MNKVRSNSLFLILLCYPLYLLIDWNLFIYFTDCVSGWLLLFIKKSCLCTETFNYEAKFHPQNYFVPFQNPQSIGIRKVVDVSRLCMKTLEASVHKLGPTIALAGSHITSNRIFSVLASFWLSHRWWQIRYSHRKTFAKRTGTPFQVPPRCARHHLDYSFMSGRLPKAIHSKSWHRHLASQDMPLLQSVLYVFKMTKGKRGS